MTTIDRFYEIRNGVSPFIDTQALGFSARVFLATSYRSGEDVAFKILRKEHLKDETVWERFGIEARLLQLLADTPVAVKLIDCGFVSDLGQEIPSSGEILSLDQDVKTYCDKLLEFRLNNWRPYLALELVPRSQCLLNLIRGSDGEGMDPLRLPTEKGLELAIQFTQFLKLMHERGAIYVDHKPEHVYWDGKQLRVIDFNVSQFLDPKIGTQAKTIEFQKDLRNMAAGVLYTIFTGRDFRYQGLHSGPMANPSDPSALEKKFSVASLDFGMEENLLPSLPPLINRPLNLKAPITSEQFLKGLCECAAQSGREGLGFNVDESHRKARQEVLKGLAELEKAQEALRRARRHFEAAVTQAPIDQDCKRLYRETTEFLKHRVLP